nr:Phospholipase A1-IIgamma [Ipomoea batatas]
MAQETYDNFNHGKASKYVGSGRYVIENLFDMVGFGKGNSFKYSITKYLYATSSVQVPEAFIVKSMSREAWSRKSNWIEFVVLGEISRLVDHYKTEEISITIVGHSIGASVGTLNAIDIVINGFNKVVAEKPSCPVTVILFASP